MCSAQPCFKTKTFQQLSEKSKAEVLGAGECSVCSPCPLWGLCSSGCAALDAGRRKQRDFCALLPSPPAALHSLSVMSSTALRRAAAPGMFLQPKFRSCLESKPNSCTPEPLKLSRAPGEVWGAFPALSPRILCFSSGILSLQGIPQLHELHLGVLSALLI